MHRIVIFLLFLLAVACQKEKVQGDYGPSREIIRLHMDKTVAAAEMMTLDWTNYAEITKNGKLLAVKVPVIGTSKANYEFLLVDVDDNGQLGRISKNKIEYQALGNYQAFPVYISNIDYSSGTLNEYHLQNKQAAGNSSSAPSLSMLLPGSRIPMVTMMGNYTESVSGAILNSTSAYILSGLLGIDGANNGLRHYTNSTTGKAAAGAKSGKIDYVDPMHNAVKDKRPQVISWDQEDSDAKKPIELDRFFSSFSMLPNDGASYIVKVYVDIPVDNSPDVLLGTDRSTGDFGPGHVFIKLSKINAGRQVNQVIGFYPRTGWMSASMMEIDSKMVDDGNAKGEQHAYNASLTIDGWSAAEFDKLLLEIKKNAKRKYELDEFNCAHFVAASINAVKPGYIDSDGVLVYDPTNSLFNNKYVSFSPNGIYKALHRAKAFSLQHASKIEVGVNKRTLPSSGPAY